MEYKSGTGREQIYLLPASIDELVGEDNAVRVIDAFVDGLSAVEIGLIHSTLGGHWAATGRPLGGHWAAAV